MIELNKKRIFPNSKRIEEIREFINNNEENKAGHLYDKVDVTAEAEQENEEVLGEMEQPDLNTLPEEPSEPKKASNMSAKEEFNLN